MNREKLLDMYNVASEISEDIKKKQDYIEKRKIERKELLTQYRIKSVDRVLDFVRNEYRAGRKAVSVGGVN